MTTWQPSSALHTTGSLPTHAPALQRSVVVHAGSDGLRAYIYVADVEQTLTAVVASGGQIVSPPYPEGTLRVALFADPAGNVLGIWQETAASLDPP